MAKKNSKTKHQKVKESPSSQSQPGHEKPSDSQASPNDSQHQQADISGSSLSSQPQSGHEQPSDSPASSNNSSLDGHQQANISGPSLLSEASVDSQFFAGMDEHGAVANNQEHQSEFVHQALGNTAGLGMFSQVLSSSSVAGQKNSAGIHPQEEIDTDPVDVDTTIVAPDLEDGESSVVHEQSGLKTTPPSCSSVAGQDDSAGSHHQEELAVDTDPVDADPMTSHQGSSSSSAAQNKTVLSVNSLLKSSLSVSSTAKAGSDAAPEDSNADPEDSNAAKAADNADTAKKKSSVFEFITWSVGVFVSVIAWPFKKILSILSAPFFTQEVDASPVDPKSPVDPNKPPVGQPIANPSPEGNQSTVASGPTTAAQSSC